MADVFGIKSKITVIWKKYLHMENIQNQEQKKNEL